MKLAGAGCLAVILIASLWAGVASITASAQAELYNESYRNRLAYSAARGWNNDPNGLLYADGEYHMYYQYNYDKTTDSTANIWGHMSWGHAVSDDLVHWTEQPVALPEGTQGDDGYVYGMMFSGSAVYDEYNTSGLFDSQDGKTVKGQGIVAILTQPDDGAGGQRQILAYSKDNGQSFAVHGEILGAKDDGGVGDGEFRDPKVFRNDKLGKWLMVVGGGSVRMYSSENLTDWEYLGQTGYWGECPDLLKFEVGGKEKYVLVISPEDKAKSHEYNATNRADTYYPAEYYAVGELDEKGLFVSDDKIKRLSEGIDSYAFQSFNNAPDGKVYGVSWAASWKSVSEYEKFRKNYNGGMTVVCELNLVEDGDGYVLTRTPVNGYEGLRKEVLKEFDGRLTADSNALAGVRADIAEVELQLDFTNSTATCAELCLRVSPAEKISLRYDVTGETLTLDRSKSSLIAQNTALFAIPYSKQVPLKDGRLSVKVLLDRAFVSVFADGGRASFFSAVFPSAVSDGFQLTSNGDVDVKAKVWALNGVLGGGHSEDELIVSTDKIDAVVGSTYAVVASSYSENFDYGQVEFAVTAGSECVKVEYVNGTAFIKAVKKGFARIEVRYGGVRRSVEVFIYNNGFDSNVCYDLRLGGFSFTADDGLRFDTGESDAFLFSGTQGENFIYTAEFTHTDNGSQAGGLVFGVSGNLSDYWVATADVRYGKIKLWRSGIGDLKTADYDFDGGGRKVKLTLVVNGKTAKIFVGNEKTAVLTQYLTDYSGGKIGLNVYNAKTAINNVAFKDLGAEENGIDLSGYKVLKVVNVTDGSYRLDDGEYTVKDGRVSVNREYLSTLENGKVYVFRIYTQFTEFDITVKADFAPSSLYVLKNEYSRDESLTLGVSGTAEVFRVEIDGEQCEFTFEGGLVTVDGSSLKDLITGRHTVKVYTANGRLQTEFSVTGGNDFRDEDIDEISYTFFYIDLALFVTAGVGFAVVTVILKYKNSGGRRKK